MTSRFSVYGILFLVFVGSVAIGVLFPVESVLREFAAVPALGALFAALFQVFRDQAAFERQVLLQQQQQSFSLGAASHMAGVAFDKHAEFCEGYIAEVHLTMSTLFREGPTKTALAHSSKLVDLKRQYSAWLTRDIIKELEPFEQALRKIGALSHLVADLRGTDDPARQGAIEKMYSVFNEVVPIEVDGTVETTSEITADAVQDRIRAILGVEQLTTIRQRLIDQALKLPNHIAG